MKTPCKNCPFRRTNAWYGLYGSAPNACAKIDALKALDEQQIFSCHVTNPDSNIFTMKPMTNDDCAGFKMMKENMATPNKHQAIVNNFNETGPKYDLVYWAKKENYKSKFL